MQPLVTSPMLVDIWYTAITLQHILSNYFFASLDLLSFQNGLRIKIYTWKKQNQKHKLKSLEQSIINESPRKPNPREDSRSTFLGIRCPFVLESWRPCADLPWSVVPYLCWTWYFFCVKSHRRRWRILVHGCFSSQFVDSVCLQPTAERRARKQQTTEILLNAASIRAWLRSGWANTVQPKLWTPIDSD